MIYKTKEVFGALIKSESSVKLEHNSLKLLIISLNNRMGDLKIVFLIKALMKILNSIKTSFIFVEPVYLYRSLYIYKYNFSHLKFEIYFQHNFGNSSKAMKRMSHIEIEVA